MTSPNPMALEAKALEAAEDVKLVGQFWPGETALESEDSNWHHYRRERYSQIIRAYLAALPLPAAGEGLEPLAEMIERIINGTSPMSRWVASVDYSTYDGFEEYLKAQLRDKLRLKISLDKDRTGDKEKLASFVDGGAGALEAALGTYRVVRERLAASTPAARAAVLEPVDLLTQFYAIRIGKAPLPISRDELGREVRTAWVRWAEQQASPKPHWLTPYDNLSEADKEADRQIGLWMANVVLDKFLELNPPSDTRTRLVATPAARAAVLEASQLTDLDRQSIDELREYAIGPLNTQLSWSAAGIILDLIETYVASSTALKEKT